MRPDDASSLESYQSYRVERAVLPYSYTEVLHDACAYTHTTLGQSESATKLGTICTKFIKIFLTNVPTQCIFRTLNEISQPLTIYGKILLAFAASVLTNLIT